jgi:hypothetical protein
MPYMMLNLIAACVFLGIGAYSLATRSFTLTFRHTHGSFILNLNGFRAICFGVVNLLNSVVIILVPLLTAILGNAFIAPDTILEVCICIWIASYISVTVFEFINVFIQDLERRKLDAKIKNCRWLLGDDGELVEVNSAGSSLHSSSKSHHSK